MAGIVHLGIVGACGKMGWVIRQLLENDDDVTVSVLIDPDIASENDSQVCGINSLEYHDLVDVMVDFSNPESAKKAAIWCAHNGKPLVTGTTGLTKKQIESLEACALKVPIVRDSNMSLGVNVIDALLPQIAKILQGFAVEIQEIHHDQKKDSPSGTALRFAETLVKAKGGEIVYGRAKGKCDNRPIGDIVVHSLRGGTVPGEHTVYFLGTDEVIKITHSALSRKIFALGAIRAAKWIVDQPPGFYNMNNVLGL